MGGSGVVTFLEVSTSGFYDRLGRQPSKRSFANAKLTGLIRQRFEARDRTYGSRRVWCDVFAWGELCGIHRIGRLMRAEGLAARRKRRRSPHDSAVRPEHSIAPNLLRRAFKAHVPSTKWLADFTYIWRAEGWLFVAVALDLYSRRIVGWSLKPEMTAQMVIDALVMAVWRRGKPKKLLHHSDQGSQFTSEDFQRLLSAHGITSSKEPPRRLPGQRGNGELLLQHEDRAGRSQTVGLPRRGQSRQLRLHRALLQPAPAALGARPPQPGSVRGDGCGVVVIETVWRIGGQTSSPSATTGANAPRCATPVSAPQG